jgi:hypothetical protein
MSLSTQTNKQSYSPAGGTTSFDFNITYFDDTDIVVTIEDVAGEITEFVNETGFSVTATNGDPSNGATIVLSVATTAGDTVVISRQVPYTQEYDLQDGSSIDPTALNTGLDRTVAQSQQLLDDGSRHLTHPITDPSGLTYDAPSVIDRASKATGWDEDGNVVALSLSDSGTVSGNENAGITISDNIVSAKVDGVTTGFDGTGNIEVIDDAITTDKLLNDAVTNAKMADNSVDTVEIVDSAVTLAKIDADASLTARGVIEQATDTEVVTGTDTDRAVSAGNITNLFSGSGRHDVVTKGYQKFPGGLVLQWGEESLSAGADTNVTLPVAPVTVLNIQGTYNSTSNSIGDSVAVNEIDTSTINVVNGAGSTKIINWFAITFEA